MSSMMSHYAPQIKELYKERQGYYHSSAERLVHYQEHAGETFMYIWKL